MPEISRHFLGCSSKCMMQKYTVWDPLLPFWHTVCREPQGAPIQDSPYVCLALFGFSTLQLFNGETGRNGAGCCLGSKGLDMPRYRQGTRICLGLGGQL